MKQNICKSCGKKIINGEAFTFPKQFITSDETIMNKEEAKKRMKKWKKGEGDLICKECAEVPMIIFSYMLKSLQEEGMGYQNIIDFLTRGK